MNKSRIRFNPTQRCARIALGVILPLGMTFAQELMKPPSIRPTQADFAAGLQAAGANPSPASRSKRPAIRGTIRAAHAPSAPIIVERSIPLTENETEALRIAHGFLTNNESKPVAGENGVVIYTYGEGIPTDVCAPMQICQINLEPGETIQLNDKKIPMLDLGDWKNWVVTPYSVGEGDKAQSYVIVKPSFSGLETTLSFPTNRRTYYVHLVSEPREYIPQISFRYPEDDQKQKMAAYAAAQAEAQQKKEAEEHLKELNTIKPIRSTAYSVELNKNARKHAPYLRPVQVYDDGAHTIIRLSETARHYDRPTLRLDGFSGVDTPNQHFDIKTLTYTIDALIDQAELISGTGRHQLQVKIKNETKDLYASNR